MRGRNFFFVWLAGWVVAVSAVGQTYKLVWSDEFDRDGLPDEKYWTFEEGYVRNEELQWYQQDNAFCRDGLLVIEARKEHRPNPLYRKDGRDWRTLRPYVECTSSSLTTAGKFEFTYGRLEVRARIPVAKGAWPAIWTLGSKMEWPSCGEIDVMEFYRIQGCPVIMANAAWGGRQTLGGPLGQPGHAHGARPGEESRLGQRVPRVAHGLDEGGDTAVSRR